MNDRRMLRRYLVMVARAEEMLEASLADSDAPPPPAEAVAMIDDLVLALGPAVRHMPCTAPRPQDIAETLAGWVH